MSWGQKGIRYYIRCEYEIIDNYKQKYSITELCKLMSVSRSGYYKWKYRKLNPSIKDLSRQADIRLIKEVHDAHPSHGYRWINAFIKNKLYIYAVNMKA